MPHFIRIFQTLSPFAPYHLLLGLSILFSFCSLVASINKNFFILHILYYFYFFCFRYRFELSFFIYFGSGPYSRSMPASALRGVSRSSSGRPAGMAACIQTARASRKYGNAQLCKQPTRKAGQRTANGTYFVKMGK